MTDRYQLNQTVSLSGHPVSKVIGIDRYKINSLNGTQKTWLSYTLSSEQGGEEKRWWLTDERSGVYAWAPIDASQVKGTLDLSESGLCTLQIEGDSSVSSPYSSVALFRDGEDLYCLESFEGAGEVFSMRGKRIKDL